MSTQAKTAATTGRKKALGHRSLATGQSGSGVPPLTPKREQSRDTSATLGHDPQNTPAPKGREKKAHGNALGNPPPNTPSPEGAKAGGNASYRMALNLVASHHSGNSKLIKGKLHDAPADNLFPAFSATGQDVWRDAYDREGDAIIISAVGARCGKCFLARGRWSAIANTHVVWPDAEKADIKFLWYLLNDEQFWIRSGSAQPFVAVRKTFEKEVFVPPLPEQRRIVAEIEKQFTRLEAGVAALRRVQSNLKRYSAAVLKAACEGKLVPNEVRSKKAEGRSVETGEQLLKRILAERRQNWLARHSLGEGGQGRGKYNEPAAPDTANLPPLPEGWAWVSVAQLGEVQLGRQRSPKNVSKNFPTKYIRAANITERGLDLSDVLEMEFTPSERERYLLRQGEIVLSEASGSASQVGKPAVWRDELPLCCFQNTVIRLRPFTIGAKYPLTVFRHFYTNGIFARVAGGVGINHLGAEKFSGIPFPLPPLAEQTRIVAEVERRLSVVEELEAVVSANLQRAVRLRQSILQKAFTGELV